MEKEEKTIATFNRDIVKDCAKKLLKKEPISLAERTNINDRQAGVYVFWWIGDSKKFKEKLKSCTYKIKSAHQFKGEKQNYINVKFTEEWIKEASLKYRNLSF